MVYNFLFTSYGNSVHLPLCHSLVRSVILFCIEASSSYPSPQGEGGQALE
jgi:hypothetical protein